MWIVRLILFLFLNILKSTKVWVVASVAEVLYDRGWCYTACLKCKKKVQDKDYKLYCVSCKDYVLGCQRFKIHINVVDGSANADFLLWNDIAVSLIEKTAAEVWDELNQVRCYFFFFVNFIASFNYLCFIVISIIKLWICLL